MEINIKNETLPVCSTVCRSKSTFSSECDIIVPDSKPDMLKVLQISAIPKVTNCEIRSGHVIASGSVRFDILYLADDEEKCVKSITSSCEFSNLVRDSNITDSMLAFSDIEVCGIVCDISNCRKLSVKATLCMNAVVYSCHNLEVITDIENACTKKQVLKSDIICAHARDLSVITDSFPLSQGKSPIKEILKSDAVITDSSLKIIDDKAILKGNISVTILYQSESALEYARTEVAFAHILEADGIREDMNCEHKVSLADLSASAGEDSEGRKTVIDISIQLDMKVIARRSFEISCATDAFIPRGEIECKKSSVCVDNTEMVIKRDADFREKIVLPDGAAPIESVYQIIARPFTESCVSEGDKLRISGYTEIYLLYLSSDGETPVCSYKANSDFEVECESPGCMLTPIASCTLRNISYTISDSNSVELRGCVDVQIECIRSTETEVIYSAHECEYTPPKRPSIIVSCIHSGRSLWDIAQEYRVSPESILIANAIENESEIHSGKALIIPK